MKGHLRKRAKGSWTIVVDAGKDAESGRRQQHWHTVRGTTRDAQRALNEMLVAIDKASYCKPSRLTLGSWLTEWLDSYIATHVTPRTQESYRSIICRHVLPALGLIPLNQLQPRHLQDYYAKALTVGRADGKGGLSARSVLYQHRILSEALDNAVRMGMLARNVADFADPPRPSAKKMRTMSPEEIMRFLDTAHQTSYYVFFSTLLCTGLRRGELLALRWPNLDLDQAVLHVVETAFRLGNGEYVTKEPKTKHSRRAVSLPRSLVSLLRAYRTDQRHLRAKVGAGLADDGFVFAHADCSPLNPNAITLAFKRIVRRAGLGHIRVHDLRHTHASLMLKAGVHPKVVSERLGHATVGITLDTYSHVLPGLQEAAAERFDQVLSMEEREEAIDVSRMLAEGGSDSGRPYRIRTCDTLIKSQVLCQLS